MRRCALLIRGWLLVVCVLTLAGCGKTPPPVTEVEGTLLLNNQPLPNAQVTFMPDLAGFGAELNSTAITDDEGKFRLTCAQKGEPGAVVAKHRVLVTEAPVPAELRSPAAQEKLAAFQAKLKNRPIPEEYATFGKTPLIVDVMPEQKTYVLKMKR